MSAATQVVGKLFARHRSPRCFSVGVDPEFLAPHILTHPGHIRDIAFADENLFFDYRHLLHSNPVLG